MTEDSLRRTLFTSPPPSSLVHPPGTPSSFTPLALKRLCEAAPVPLAVAAANAALRAAKCPAFASDTPSPPLAGLVDSAPSTLRRPNHTLPIISKPTSSTSSRATPSRNELQRWMARDSNSVQGNYNRKLGKRPRDHISHPLAPPSMHMPYLRIKQDPDHSKENSALSVFKTENNLHLPSNITPRVGVRGFVTAQPSPMSSRAALKRCITFPSVGEGSKTMLVKKAGTNDSVERATLRKLENVVNEENGQGRSDEVSKQKTGFSDANSLLSGQADEHEKFVASSQCPVLENVESTINVGVCLQDSPSPSPAETTEKMNETVDVPQKKVEPAADSPKGRDFVVPRKKRLRSETPQKKNLEEKMSQEKASVTVIEKKEERMDLSNRRETRASAKKKRASRAYEKIQTISDVDKKKRVNTKVSRKRGLLSEVLRLQKALETAVWTDSTVVQRQTEVMRVEEEDLFCKRKRRRSVTSPYMDRSSSYTKEAEQGLSLKRESGKDVKGGSKKASKGGVKKKRRTDPVHDKGASFSGEDGATYARRKRKTLFPKKLPRS